MKEKGKKAEIKEFCFEKTGQFGCFAAQKEQPEGWILLVQRAPEVLLVSPKGLYAPC